MGDNSISFEINGKPYKVFGGQYAVTTSLSTFIRDVAGLKGTKVMCQEGGCGACIVTVTCMQPGSDEEKTHAINSCLCPLYSVAGWQITTVEGLGGHRKGYHPIQDRAAKFYASQCGFCTPGVVMNMYGVLSENPKPSRFHVENSFAGNLCRCTGYRPILDAMNSFATDSVDAQYGPIDIEDMNKYLCPKTGQPCTGGEVDTGELTIGQQKWYRPDSVKTLMDLMMKHRDNQIRLLFGNTGAGIYDDFEGFDVYIDLHGVSELYKLEIESDKVTIGANHTLSSLVTIFSGLVKQSGFQYCGSLIGHLYKIGNGPLKNVSTWAGNLMLKHQHRNFQSDLFVMMAAAGARVEISDCLSSGKARCLSLEEFLEEDMTHKLITSIKLYKLDPRDVFRSFKIAPRAQNSYAVVCTAFRLRIDQEEKSVIGHPSLLLGGISAAQDHPKKTEEFLAGKKLTEPGIIKEAIKILKSELTPDSDPILASAEYRVDLAANLLYKTLLGILGDKTDSLLRSGAGNLFRPLATSERHYQTKPEEFPVKQPMPQVEAGLQASGEVLYTNDIPTQEGELHAAFVLSKVGNAYIDNIDSKEAMSVPGVDCIITAADIPGQIDPYVKYEKWSEKIMCSDFVAFAGRELAIVIADTHEHAVAAAKLVKVTYKNQNPVISTIREAIEKKSFHDDVTCEDFVLGTPEETMKTAAHTVSGEVDMTAVYHMYLENQVTLCIPHEDQMEVHCSTQWPEFMQNVIAKCLDRPMSSVRVSTNRLGGAFGGKCFPMSSTACAAALGTHVTGKPVRMNVSLRDNMQKSGKRPALLVKYQVGFDSDGRLQSIILDNYWDSGYIPGEVWAISEDLAPSIGQAYRCTNWHLRHYLMKTHKASNTSMRTPAIIPSGMIMETILDHVAHTVNKNPIDVKELNFLQKGQIDMFGHLLTECNITAIWHELKRTAEVEKRLAEIAEFNKVNRWRKRGFSMTPMKYGMFWPKLDKSAYLAVYARDGSVAVGIGGVEMGQGIYTKVCQAVAWTLGIPMHLVKIKPTDTLVSANDAISGGSVTTEQCVEALLVCCDVLKNRMKPVKANNPTSDWAALIWECYKANIDLTVKYRTEHVKTTRFDYFIYGAAATETELDILTGEYLLKRVDFLIDCGESLNPELDMGQIEGAYIMGIGQWTTEEVLHDPDTGAVINASTWDYHVPSARDIPADWRITMMPNVPNPICILGSKGLGEPPILFSIGVVFALKRAIESARMDLSGETAYFPIGQLPLNVERRQQLCRVSTDKLQEM